MPDDGEPGFFSVRPKALIYIGAITGSLLVVALVAAWFVLPRYAPAFVVAESPWLGPAFTAAIHGKQLENFRRRLPEWEEAVVPAMISALGSREPARRGFAAEVLGDRGERGAVEPLILLLADRVPLVRLEAAGALQEIGDIRAVEPLLRMARTASTAHMRRSAATAASALVHEQLFDQVSSILLAPSETAETQALGCLALSRSADPRALVVLEERLGRSSYAAQAFMDRDLAGMALGWSPQAGAVPIIVRGLRSADVNRRHAALVAAFYRRKHPDLVEPLLALCDDPEPLIQEDLGLVLGFINDARVVAPLCRLVAQGAGLARPPPAD